MVNLQAQNQHLVSEDTYTEKISIGTKIRSYTALLKLRLSVLVVLSAVAGFLYAGTLFTWVEFMYLVIGGFMVTGASNGLNQVVERELDAKMDRTKGRPIPSAKLSLLEAAIFSSVTAVVGLAMLWQLNFLSFVLGALALFMYVALYTPLKKNTPFAVFVGAFPGAIPPMLGWVAATGTFGIEPGILFMLQFMWQFPHFWAIAWVLHDDYAKGGFRLLPSAEGRGKKSAYQILLYTLFTIPVGMLPWVFEMSGVWALSISLLASIGFSYFALRLFWSCELKHARQLMFASFIYLPIVLFVQVFDKAAAKGIDSVWLEVIQQL